MLTGFAQTMDEQFLALAMGAKTADADGSPVVFLKRGPQATQDVFEVLEQNKVAVIGRKGPDERVRFDEDAFETYFGDTRVVVQWQGEPIFRFTLLGLH